MTATNRQHEFAPVVRDGVTVGFAYVLRDTVIGGPVLASTFLFPGPGGPIPEPHELPLCGCDPGTLVDVSILAPGYAPGDWTAKVCVKPHRRITGPSPSPRP